MNFAQPLWLAAGAVCCIILLVLCRVIDARRRSAMSRFAAGHLVEQLTSSVSTPRLWIKRTFFLLGIAFLFTALARPQWGFRWEETKRTGLDILFAVDTSKSMLAQDVKPDRLTRAKLGVTDMVAQLEGDRVGLIAFAGSAFLQCPLTLDYDAFYQSLDALDTAIIPRGGTNVAAAIHEAGTALSQDEKREKILILLTDGEDLEGAGLDAAKAAAQQGMKIFTVGVGSQGGELIPVPTEGGGTEFLKDASGNFVKSKLDASMLQKIAQATGGIYEPLGSRGEGLQAIYDQGLAHLTKHDLASRMRKVFFERFQWPLAAGLLLLVLELLISNRATIRIRKAVSIPVKKASSVIKRTPAPTAGITAALALMLLPSISHASASQAAKAYNAGDYPTAAAEFEQAAAKNPASAELQFNTGAASYKTASFDKAAESFEKTLQSKDLNLQQQAYYNLGNAQYRIGQLTEKSEPKKTIETWKQAIQSYEAALQLKKDDADAIYNRDLVKRKLEQLQKEQDKKDQQDKQDQKDKQDDKKDEDKKDQDQKNQDQQQKDDQQKKEGDSQDKKDGNDQKDQNGQPKQDQQGQDQQGKDGNEKKDSSGGDEKKDQQAKQDPKQGSQPKPDPKGEPKERNPQQAGAKPKEGKDQQAGAQPQRVPGQMSREEAAQLLDSLKDDAKKFPAATAVNATGTPQPEDSKKDW